MKPICSFLVLTLITLYVSLPATAQTEQFRVEDIRVEGNQRVSQGTIFAAMPVRLGDIVTADDIRETVRSLMRTGYFDDVVPQREGNVLVITVVERPAISEITIEGNKAIKTDDLLKNLSDNGLAEGQIFQQATLEGMAQALRQQYISQGRYNASIDTEITKLPRNQVKINILVNEGKEARIKHINIIGNKAFDDETLLDLFELKTSGWFSWLNGNDKISSEKLSGDLERLESFYLDRGYLAFNIDSAPVSISPDKESFYITVNLTEGDVYTINKISLSGDPILPEDEIRRFILLREGQTFSQVLMTTTSDYINQRLGNEGYTFAKTEGVTELNHENKTVDVTFHIDPGKRAYVRRIEFRGNTKTADEVLRREMVQMEGGSASTAQIESSKTELERLGFFKEVEVETNEVPGTADQVDVEYTVEEQPSGAISFTVGYSQGFGAQVGASVSDNNWFGTGKQIGFSINYNTYQKNYSFNYNDPYFTPDGGSRGFSVFYRQTDYEEFNIASYSTDQYGATLSFGYRISPIDQVGLSLGYTNIFVEVGNYAVQEILSSPRLIAGFPNRYIAQSDYDNILSPAYLRTGLDDYPISDINNIAITSFAPHGPIDPNPYSGFIDHHGNEFNMLTATLSWLKSTLNRGASGLSNRGYQNQASLEVSAPGGDLEYYKLRYSGQYFQPLTQKLTLRLRTELGYAGAFGNTEEVPFFEHFYAGGFGSVRGFERNTLGPRSTTAELITNPVTIGAVDNDGDGFVDAFSADPNDYVYIQCETAGLDGCRNDNIGKIGSTVFNVEEDPFGGNVLIEGSIELLFPLPFIKDQRSVQSAFFIDAGSVFDTNCGPRQQNCFDIGWEGMSASYGIGVTWISGFGPLTFSISRPIQEQVLDKTEFFQFSLGTQF